MSKLSRFLPKSEEAVHRCSIKVLFWRVLKNSRETICKSLVLSNVTCLLLINLFLKSLLYKRFPVNFVKYFTAFFSQSTSGRLLILHILLFAESTSFPKYYSRHVFLFPLNIFRANHVDCLHEAISGVPRQLVVTELIYCW